MATPASVVPEASVRFAMQKASQSPLKGAEVLHLNTQIGSQGIIQATHIALGARWLAVAVVGDAAEMIDFQKVAVALRRARPDTG